MKKSTRNAIIAIAVVVVLALAAFLIWKASAPKAEIGDKTITVQITHHDGTEKTESINTNAETLWDAMSEKQLIDGTDSEYGKWVMTVDGEAADESAGQYWMFTKGGEWVETSCDTTMIADGEEYEFFIYES